MYEREDSGRQSNRLDEIHAELVDALRGQVEPARAAALMAQLVQATAQMVSGQCRKEHDDGEYADLRPVYDEDGLKYCCTGSPAHCTGVIAQ